MDFPGWTKGDRDFYVTTDGHFVVQSDLENIFDLDDATMVWIVSDDATDDDDMIGCDEAFLDSYPTEQEAKAAVEDWYATQVSPEEARAAMLVLKGQLEGEDATWS